MNDARLFVVAGWKYEPEWLVDDMKENMKWADKICIVDTRHRTDEFWINEGEYRLLQRDALEKAGIREGDWVFVTSPDERLEKGAEQVIRQKIAEQKKCIYSFKLREMFTPTEYRIDGIWGRKKRSRLYPYFKEQTFSKRRIQQQPTPVEITEKRSIRLNIYHLKMIEPENRISRADAYKRTDPNYRYQRKNTPALKRIDPEGKFNTYGYDYLYNLDGMKLEKVPPNKKFYPPYTNKYYFETSN